MMTRRFSILFGPFITLGILAWMSVPATAQAQELIHFDCVQGVAPSSADIPSQDLVNAPPNDLQCLATGEAVAGKGTIHPNLEIKSPHGHKLVKIRSQDDTHFTFVSQDAQNQSNNCLEFLDEGRQFVSDEFGGAWGFGDATSCVGESCAEGTSSKVELDFILHDMTASEFSIRMVDWGDYRPSADNPDNFQVTLTAYDESGSVVDMFNHHFAVENHGEEAVYVAFECVSEVDNTCREDGNNLLREGDACYANMEEPGYLTLAVDGTGISRLELRVPSHGYDPNVGFDSIRFTPE